MSLHCTHSRQAKWRPLRLTPLPIRNIIIIIITITRDTERERERKKWWGVVIENSYLLRRVYGPQNQNPQKECTRGYTEGGEKETERRERRGRDLNLNVSKHQAGSKRTTRPKITSKPFITYTATPPPPLPSDPTTWPKGERNSYANLSELIIHKGN